MVNRFAHRTLSLAAFALMSLLSVFLLLLSVAAPASAQGTQNIDLRKASTPLVPRMRVEVLLRDESIDMQVKGSNAMMFGGGLIGALIQVGVDSSRRKSAAAATADIRARVGELPLGEWIVDAVNRKLDRTVFAHELDIVPMRLPKGELLQRRDLPAQSCVLILESEFCFDPEGKQLKVDINITIENRISVDGRTLPPAVEFARGVRVHRPGCRRRRGPRCAHGAVGSTHRRSRLRAAPAA